MSDTIGTLSWQLKTLLNLPDDASRNAKQQRGRDFEKFLQALFEAEGLKPRLRLRPSGEEIDGSFLLGGRVFLVEAKWHAHPMPASALYAFKGKVDGKLVSTIGIFVSMSGYSKDAVNALTAGKSLNVLLFDREDIEASVGVNGEFIRVLEAKLRAAAEGGSVFFSYRTAEVTRTDAAHAKVMETMGTTTVSTGETDHQYNMFIVCEGMIDRHLLSRLTYQVLEREKRKGTVRIVAAMGRLNLPRVANSLMALGGEDTHGLIVADGDGDSTGVEHDIRDQLRNPTVETIVVEPSVEAWLLPDEQDPHRVLQELRQEANASLQRTVERLTEDVDIETLRRRSPSFAKVYEFLLNHSGGVET